MSPHVGTAIVATNTVVLLLGGLITYLSYRAYRRTGSSPLRALAAGFALVTLGSIVGGILDLAVGTRLVTSVLVRSVLTALGFAVITYSLYSE